MNPACSASLLMNDTEVRFRLLHTSVVKNIDISISIDTEISERYQY